MPIPNESEWDKTAKDYRGSNVIWINQSGDTQLKEANSAGVCFAITRDWVKNYRRAKIDRSNFVNAFRDVQRGKPPQNLPAIYLKKQAQYSAELQAQRDALGNLRTQLETATANSRPTKEELERITLSIGRHQYGRSVLSVKVFNGSLSGMTEAIGEIKKIGATTPSYFMLSFTRPGQGGHVVGFECRPDISAGSFPKLYEFIDANLGLYVFGNVSDVVDFFSVPVWADLYESRGYSKFILAQYDAGHGGFG